MRGYRDCSCAVGIWKLSCDRKRWLDAGNSCCSLYVSSNSEVRNNHTLSKIELTKPRFKYMGPIVRRPIGAHPGLNFHPGFFFFSSKAFFFRYYSLLSLDHPIIKLQTKRIKPNLLFTLSFLNSKFCTNPGLSWPSLEHPVHEDYAINLLDFSRHIFCNNRIFHDAKRFQRKQPPYFEKNWKGSYINLSIHSSFTIFQLKVSEISTQWLSKTFYPERECKLGWNIP